MTDEQKTTVKGYVTKLNSDIDEGELLDLVVDTVSDRVLLYLNTTEVADTMLTSIAQVIVGVYKHSQAGGTGADQSVASVSDNGQSISYRVSPTQYLASANDQELFTGFERLLAPYRRVHVITSEL